MFVIVVRYFNNMEKINDKMIKDIDINIFEMFDKNILRILYY